MAGAASLSDDDRAFLADAARALRAGSARVAIGFPDDHDIAAELRRDAEAELRSLLGDFPWKTLALDPFMPELGIHLVSFDASERRESIFEVDGLAALQMADPDLAARAMREVDAAVGSGELRVLVWLDGGTWEGFRAEARRFCETARTRLLNSPRANSISAAPIPSPELAVPTATESTVRSPARTGIRERLQAAKTEAQAAKDEASVEPWLRVAMFAARMGRLADARGALDSAAKNARSAVARGAVAEAEGMLELSTGRLGAATAHFTRALELSREAADGVAEWRALARLGIAAWRSGDFPEAYARLSRSTASRIRNDALLDAEVRRILARRHEALSRFESVLEASALAPESVDARLGIAAVLLAAGRTKRARAELDIALEDARLSEDQHGEAEALFARGEILLANGDWDDAAVSFADARDAYRALGDSAGEARSLHGIGKARCPPQDFGAARAAWEEARVRFAAAGARLGEAETLFGIAETCRMTTASPAAVEHYATARALCHALAHHRGEANCVALLATEALQGDRFRDVLALGDEALGLIEGLDDRLESAWSIDDGGLWYLFGFRVRPSLLAALFPRRDAGTDVHGRAALIVADLHLLLHMPRRAVATSYSEAVSRFRAAGDRGGLAEALRRGAIADLDDDEMWRGDAQEMLEEALPIFFETGDSFGIASCMRALGGTHLEMDEAADARRCFGEARVAFRTLGNLRNESLAASGELSAAMALGDATGARESLAQAILLLRELDDSAAQAELFLSFASFRMLAGDPSGAIESLQEACLLIEGPANESFAARERAARMLAALGEALRTLGEPLRAQDAAERAAAILRVTPDRLGEARALGTLGALAFARGDAQGALDIHRRALESLSEVETADAERGRGLALAGVSRALRLLDRAAEAQAPAEEAVARLENARGDVDAIAAARLELAEVLVALGDPSTARKQVLAARDAFAERRDRTGYAECEVFLTRLG